MRHVLFDTNVLLDIFLQRAPHWQASAAAFGLAATGRVKGYVAGHAMTTIAYILEQEIGDKKTRAVLTEALSVLDVAAIDDSGIRAALQSPIADFEDAVTEISARRAGVSVVITRNTTDFAKSRVPALPPDAFVAGFG